MSPSLQMPISVSDVVPLDVELHQNLPSLQTENKALFLTANLPQNFFSQLLKKGFQCFSYKDIPMTDPLPLPPKFGKKGRSRTSRLFSVPAAITQQFLLSRE